MTSSLTSNAGTVGVDAVTPAQVADVVRVVEAAARGVAEEVIGRLVASGQFTKASFQQVVTSRDKTKAAVVTTLSTTLKELILRLARPSTRCISLGKNLTLEPTDGKRTVAKANKTFRYIDVAFTNYGTDVPGRARGETVPVVYEIVEDSTLEQVFGSFSADMNALCFEQDQIIDFVKTYPGWFPPGGYVIFFLFKVGEKFFVAGVNLYRNYLHPVDELRVYVYHFSDSYVWGGRCRHRLVVPQLAPPTA